MPKLVCSCPSRPDHRSQRPPRPVAAALVALLACTLGALHGRPAAAQPDVSGDAPPARVLFVDASAAAGGTGTSWDEAFRDLQDALDAARAGDEIWVAGGFYVPGSSVDSTFVVGVPVRGGFTGDEAAPEERVLPAEEPTILSGDIEGDDVLGSSGVRNNLSENANHVVTLLEDAVLDGLIVEGGNARGDASGGGVFAVEGGWSLVDVVLRENFANGNGGALALDGSGRIVLERVVMERNRANVEGGSVFLGGNAVAELREVRITTSRALTGGALSLADSARVEAEGCALLDNSAVAGSGAVNLGSSLSGGLPPVLFDGCVFEGNLSTGPGAALGTGTSEGGPFGPLQLVDCHFVDNQASSHGGAVYAADTRDLQIRGGSVRGNSAAGGGGGFYFEDYRDVLIDGVWFSGNRAVAGGALGLVRTTEGARGSVTISDGVFEGNVAFEGSGGAVLASGFLTLVVDACEMVDNESSYGGAIDATAASITATAASFTVQGCLFDGNTSTSTAGAVAAAVDGVTVRDTTFRGGLSGGDAAAMHVRTQVAVISGSRFEDNSARGRTGGALLIEAVEPASATAELTDCHFEGNAGTRFGAAGIGSGVVDVVGGSFVGNSASLGVGGLAVEAVGRVRVEGVRFEDNSSEGGAGAAALASSDSGEVVDCAFVGNDSRDGSALFVDTALSARLERVEVRGNLGTGATVNSDATLISSSLFADNRALDGGAGGLELGSSASDTPTPPTLIHTTFAGNSSAAGPSELAASFATVRLVNSLLDDASLPGRATVTRADAGDLALEITATRLDPDDLGAKVTLVGEPLDVDYTFVDARDGDYRLRAGSGVIDAGNSAAADGVDFDLAGSDRVVGSGPDLGAYERACNNHGVSRAAVCACEEGFGGDECERCDPEEIDCAGFCSGNGELVDDACECDPTWDGDDCEVCAEGWSGEGCDVCDPGAVDCSAFCNGNGRFLGPGSCECDDHFTGDQCDTCELGFSGDACDRCADRFTGPECDRCLGNFTGELCDGCLLGFAGPNCTSCAEGFTGDECDRCAPGFSGRTCEPDVVEPSPDLGVDADAGDAEVDAADVADAADAEVGGPDVAPEVGDDPDVGEDAGDAGDGGGDADDAGIDVGGDAEVEVGGETGGGVVPVGQVPTEVGDDEVGGCAQGGGIGASWPWLLAIVASVWRRRGEKREKRE